MKKVLSNYASFLSLSLPFSPALNCSSRALETILLELRVFFLHAFAGDFGSILNVVVEMECLFCVALSFPFETAPFLRDRLYEKNVLPLLLHEEMHTASTISFSLP